MKSFAELAEWIDGAIEEFGDPSVPVCQIFVRWQQNLPAYRGTDLACGLVNGNAALILTPAFRPLVLPLSAGDAEIGERGELVRFGAKAVTPGVWALDPSFNDPGFVHAFIVLYDVPSPAPWEQRIVLPGDSRFGCPA